MIILSHRGFWKTRKEMNTPDAFIRSFKEGFGTETDIRDLNGKLVISHDPPGDNSISFSEFADVYNTYGRDLPLALNVKSDGLQELVQAHLKTSAIDNYFFFDMSIPDMRHYIRLNLKTFTRQSELEKIPSLYGEAQGLWLDEFESHWINQKVLKKHIRAGKKICIVSPELHGRSSDREWNDYRTIEKKIGVKDILLCTDHPDRAKVFFES